MTDYTKSTNFATKDSLLSGNPLKIVKGTEIDTEFNNIATSIATKADLASPTLTGTPTAPTATGGTNTTQVATTAFVDSGFAKKGSNSDITSLSGLTTALSVAQGGTGSTSLTSAAVLVGNGTSAVNSVAPGSSSNVLASNGSAWASTALQNLSGFNRSLSSNGYQYLPGGLLLQWGTASGVAANTTVTVNFNVAFASAAVYVNFAIQDYTGSNEEMSTPFAYPISTSQFDIRNTDGDTAIGTYRWFAIGY